MNRRDFIKLLGKVAGALGVAGVMGLPEVEAIDDYELAKELVLKFRRDAQMGVVLPGPKEDIEAAAWEPRAYPIRIYDTDGNLIDTIEPVRLTYDSATGDWRMPVIFYEEE